MRLNETRLHGPSAVQYLDEMSTTERTRELLGEIDEGIDAELNADPGYTEIEAAGEVIYCSEAELPTDGVQLALPVCVKHWCDSSD